MSAFTAASFFFTSSTISRCRCPQKIRPPASAAVAHTSLLPSRSPFRMNGVRSSRPVRAYANASASSAAQ